MFYIQVIAMKFYFSYIFHSYVICFIMYLLHIYMYDYVFLFLLFISVFTFLFSLNVQNCYDVKFLL